GLASMQIAARAFAEERNDQFRDALADYDTVLDLLARQPDTLLRFVLLVNRGYLFVQHLDWEKAASDFEAAARLNPQRVESFVGLATVHRGQDKPDAAIEQFSRAIALEPRSAALYRARAEAELARGSLTAQERTRALTDLAEAIRFEGKANPVVALDHGCTSASASSGVGAKTSI